jgi:hypothetical protein
MLNGEGIPSATRFDCLLEVATEFYNRSSLPFFHKTVTRSMVMALVSGPWGFSMVTCDSAYLARFELKSKLGDISIVVYIQCWLLDDLARRELKCKLREYLAWVELNQTFSLGLI